MRDLAQLWEVLKRADLVCSEEQLRLAVQRVAREVTGVLAERVPLVLTVMGGAVVFTGQLLPLLHAAACRAGPSSGR
jgi:hypoxanthine phosphoribosyltransferase